MRKMLITATLLASTIASSGCYSGKQLPNINYEQYAVHYADEGIKFGVEPIETSQRCRELFGDDITDCFLPFYVHIGNENANGLRINGGFEFRDKHGSLWEQVDWAQLAEEKHRKAGLEAILVPGPLKQFMFNNASSWNKSVDRHYKSKILPYNLEIKPHSFERGFVVFSVPNKLETQDNFSQDLDGGELIINYQQAGKIERFKLPIKAHNSDGTK